MYEYIKNYYKDKRVIISKIPNEIITFLSDKFTGLTLKGKIIAIKNGYTETPLCPICGKPLKLKNSYFLQTCGEQSCISQLHKQTFKNNYGVDNLFQLDSVKKKIKATCLKKYGVDNPAKSTVIQYKIKVTNNEKYGCDYGLSNESVKKKSKETCIEKYGVDNVAKCSEIQEEKKLHNLIKYGKEYTTQVPEVIEKIHNSKSRNKTHSCSKEEDSVFLLLTSIYTNVIRQYKSDLYPFNCDFYIPEKDLYIECNFHWTHGTHPFNKNDINDVNKLNIWKNKAITQNYYKDAIEVWTNRDPNKRKTAIMNKLNYLEFFSFNELKTYFQI